MTVQEVIYLILIFCFGWFTVNLLVKNITLEEHLGLSILLGFGIHSVLYFIFVLYFGLFNTSSLIFLTGEVLVVLLLSFFIKKNTSHIQIKNDRKFGLIINTVLIALSSIILLYTFVQCTYWPVYEPDTLYFYDFRAQRLLEGDLNTFFRGTSFYQNNLYPPFTSLMHFFLYQVGAINPKIIYPIILLSFYFVIVGYVKRKTKSNLSGLLTGTLILLTPSIMWNSVIAINNIVFMTYLSLACLYLFDDSDIGRGTNGGIIIGSILLGLSSWVRIEPFWLVPAVLFSVKSLLKKRIKLLILFFIIVISMTRLWPESNRRYNVTIIPPAIKIVEQVKAVIYQTRTHDLAYNSNVAIYFLQPLYKSWGLVFPFFMAVVIAEIVIFKKIPDWIETVAIFLSFSVILGIVSFSNRFTEWSDLGNSVYRMATIAIPLFWVSIVTSKVWKRLFLSK